MVPVAQLYLGSAYAFSAAREAGAASSPPVGVNCRALSEDFVGLGLCFEGI